MCLTTMSKNLASVPCGHIFHLQCISDCLKHRWKCPNCRTAAKPSQITKIHFNIEDSENTHATKMYDAQKKTIKNYESEIKMFEKRNVEIEGMIEARETQLKLYQEKFKGYPTHLGKLREFPKLPEKVMKILQRHSPTVHHLSTYLPPENTESPEVGPFFDSENSVVYQGQYFDQLRHGRGRAFWKNGNYYYGTWNSDQMTGFGILVKKKGSYAIGNFLRGKLNGKGTYSRLNGESYEGDWTDGKKDGLGVETVPGKSKYTGQFIDNARVGHGKVEFEGGKVYNGEFVGGMINGNGKISYRDGRE